MNMGVHARGLVRPGSVRHPSTMTKLTGDSSSEGGEDDV